MRKYLMNRLLQDRVHYICNQSTFYCILKSSSIVCSYLLIASAQVLWYFVIVNHTCFPNTRYVVFEELIAVFTATHIWIIGGHTDLRTQIIDSLTDIFCKETRSDEWKSWLNSSVLLSVFSLLPSSPSASRMSVQQSSIMSSHGEPNREFSLEHCWFVEPITRPILHASQQSCDFYHAILWF